MKDLGQVRKGFRKDWRMSAALHPRKGEAHILQNWACSKHPAVATVCLTGLRETEDSKALLRWGPTGHSLDTVAAASGEAVGERGIRTEARLLIQVKAVCYMRRHRMGLLSRISLGRGNACPLEPEGLVGASQVLEGTKAAFPSGQRGGAGGAGWAKAWEENPEGKWEGSQGGKHL